MDCQDNTDNNHMQTAVSAKSDGFYMEGFKVADYDVWTTLRFEFEVATHTLAIYNEGEVVATMTETEVQADDKGLAELAGATLRDLSIAPSSNCTVDLDNVVFYKVVAE